MLPCVAFYRAKELGITLVSGFRCAFFRVWDHAVATFLLLCALKRLAKGLVHREELLE